MENNQKMELNYLDVVQVVAGKFPEMIELYSETPFYVRVEDDYPREAPYEVSARGKYYLRLTNLEPKQWIQIWDATEKVALYFPSSASLLRTDFIGAQKVRNMKAKLVFFQQALVVAIAAMITFFAFAFFLLATR